MYISEFDILLFSLSYELSSLLFDLAIEATTPTNAWLFVTLQFATGRKYWPTWFDSIWSHIIHTLVIHHSFTLSLQAQNLPFQQILPTVDLFYLLDCLTITGLDRTYRAHHFIFSFAF